MCDRPKTGTTLEDSNLIFYSFLQTLCDKPMNVLWLFCFLCSEPVTVVSAVFLCRLHNNYLRCLQYACN